MDILAFQPVCKTIWTKKKRFQQICLWVYNVVPGSENQPVQKNAFTNKQATS